MIYSNEEAKERWCPFATVSVENRRTANRLPTNDIMPGSKCISDRCMMWMRVGVGTTQGYCGFAHVPEAVLSTFAS